MNLVNATNRTMRMLMVDSLALVVILSEIFKDLKIACLKIFLWWTKVIM